VDAASLKAFFDACASAWDHRPPDPARLERIAALADIGSGMDVLDIACGTGVMFGPILARNPRRLVAIDLSDAMIRVAAAKHRDPRITLIAGDFYDAPTGTFDRAVMHNAYPHFFDKERLAIRLANVVRPGGRFIIAHSLGRAQLLRHHAGKAAAYSVPLLPAEAEAAHFAPYFTIDVCIDQEDLYAISGTRRP